MLNKDDLVIVSRKRRTIQRVQTTNGIGVYYYPLASILLESREENKENENHETKSSSRWTEQNNSTLILQDLICGGIRNEQPNESFNQSHLKLSLRSYS